MPTLEDRGQKAPQLGRVDAVALEQELDDRVGQRVLERGLDAGLLVTACHGPSNRWLCVGNDRSAAVWQD
jgi:hypothetical protein